MKTPALIAPLVVAASVFLATGCAREQAADDANTVVSEPGPEAELRGQTADLMRGEGMRPADPNVALDARPLAGQAEIGVRSLLGSPSGCEDVTKGRKCRYAHAGTDITYIDGMADWITVDNLAGAPFSAAALARVGLPTNEDPIESTPQYIRWQNLAGYREVTLHAGPGGRAARIELKMATL